jgi:hypothetical protein
MVEFRGTARKAQGRPVGFLVAWLRAAEQYDDAAGDIALSTDKANHGEESISFAARAAARAWAQSQASLLPVFDLERHPRDGEGPEPFELA